MLRIAALLLLLGLLGCSKDGNPIAPQVEREKPYAPDNCGMGSPCVTPE